MVMKARIWRAMSSPAPTRPTGNAAAVLASMSRRASSGIAARIGVSIIPGDTALTRTGAQLRRGDHHMIDRAGSVEQVCDALIAGDIGRDRDCVQALRRSIQTLHISRGDDDIGTFASCQFGGRKPNAR